ncbi:HipA family kinase [Candidatus Pantoea formicae]|uniref:HipA family kinase n=1 Tax=Candidatus Pantoea formicae TaxID=2608355 RepID=UPI003EDAF5B7
MVRLKIGRLLPGFKSLGVGSRLPVRGTAFIDNAESTVIAKRIPDRELAVEVICSCIGREIGLPIPEPVLLLDPDAKWYFGSIDLGHPNLQQVAVCSDAAIISKLERWPGLVKAACFDEWIANPDRGDENMLFDGNGFILIDHGLAIPEGMRSEDWTDDFYCNQLLDMISGGCEGSSQMRAAKAQEMREWSSKFKGFSTIYGSESFPDYIAPEHKKMMSDFLTERINRLGTELYRKLNPEQGALNLDD